MERLKAVENDLSDGRRANYRPSAFMGDDMGKAYAAADCVVSRSGSAIFEIAAYGKPSVLIPLPESANDHQRMNAETYAATGAAIMLEEEDISKETLMNAIESAIKNHETMAGAAQLFAKPNTAQIIAEDIMRIAGEK
jgi:UDP-N-acetylglucosamine--N-acetylmuramyl-(pentapeptide) pyrophosphoryl-undecaprenol N-acetylglucosamine transferase